MRSILSSAVRPLVVHAGKLLLGAMGRKSGGLARLHEIDLVKT
jgi:hypothetical protein